MQATDDLYHEVLPTIVRTVRRTSRWTQPDFDDVVQTALERVVRAVRAGTFRGECSVRAWAAAIAANAAIDHHRARQRERKLFVDEGIEPDAIPAPSRGSEQAFVVRSEAARLERILREMKPMDAEVVLLRIALGFSPVEVAEELGRSEAAIESRLVRARAHVRHMLRLPPKALVRRRHTDSAA